MAISAAPWSYRAQSRSARASGTELCVIRLYNVCAGGLAHRGRDGLGLPPLEDSGAHVTS